MNPASKLQIAKVTLSLLVLVVSVFLLGVVVLVVCAGLQINPFRETTTSFLVAAFVGLIGAAIVLVLLNVATNISLIADLRVVELGVEPSPKWPKKWLLVFTATAILAITFVLVATNISKQRYVKVVHHEADDVLRENGVLLEDMSHALASGKRQDFERIRTIKSYLTNQRAGLPELTIIYSGKFDGKLTFYQTNDYIPPDNVDYLPSYFACTVGQDCEYLRRFFSGGNAEVLEKYHLRDDQFYFYVPFVGKESRYVLLFERRNSYGKVGS